MSALSRRARRKARRSGACWDAINQDSSGDVLYWLAVPMLAHEVNRRITGNANTWALTAFGESISEHLPLNRVLSLGCGTGALEREVAKRAAARHIDAVDIGLASVQEARRLAADAGYGDVIHYYHTDATGWLRHRTRQEPYDVIFFHGSLHHIEDLESTLDLCAQHLCGGSPGLLYVDEYVGPSRTEWRSWHLGFASALFGRVPEQHRRIPEVAPPIVWDDPTEMIRSSEIMGCIGKRFDILDYRPYYGNVLFPLVTAIRGQSLASAEVLEVLQAGVQLENYLSERDLIDTLYAVVVARPRDDAPQ